MVLPRDNFTPATLAVMDQVAFLLRLSEHALGLEQTYKNNSRIKRATPDTKVIVGFAKSTSVDLMEALYHSQQNKSAALERAYEAAKAGVGEAIQAAIRLVALEKELTAEQGNIMSGVVVPGLTQLQSAWCGQGVHVTEGVHGTYRYHLSAIDTTATALCGEQTMSTGLSLKQWGVKGHLNERWCTECAAAGAAALSAAGAQLPSVT